MSLAHRRLVTVFACLLSLGPGSPALAQETPPAGRPVRDLSLEELLNVEVTSVARKAQRLSDSAAAVSVLTRADIRRSGVTTLPDALRLVPGVQVARIDSNKWAVSVRGFNGRFANKLLVLVDGRSVYSPLYSGVYWETLDLPLDEIDRIEVIRGPGGTMWGANAVNGVVNIITTRAHESEGTTVAASGDSDGPGGAVTIRRGWRFGETGGARMFAKGFDRDSSAGPAPYDEWDIVRGGFRLDTGTVDRSWSAHGNVFAGRLGQTYGPQDALPDVTGPTPDDVEVAGVQLASSWNRAWSSRSHVSFRAFFDHSRRDERLVRERRDTGDVEGQHRFSGAMHDVVWGGGYRVSRDDVVGARLARFSPRAQTMHLFNAFVQDEVHLPGAVQLTLGTKLERTTFAGTKLQPSVRIMWAASEGQGVWGSISRAVRTPSRTEVGIDLAIGTLPPGAETPFPQRFMFHTTRDVQAEELLAYEVGYRRRIGDMISIDLATFINDYADLVSATVGTPDLQFGPDGPYLLVPVVGTNGGTRRSRGAEMSVEWRPAARLRLAGSYTALDVDRPPPDDQYAVRTTGHDPAHQMAVRIEIDLPRGIEVDPTYRAVSALQNGSARGYHTVDLHVGRRLSRALELAVNGRNLVGGRHVEFLPTIVNTLPSVVRPTVGLSATWRF